MARRRKRDGPIARVDDFGPKIERHLEWLLVHHYSAKGMKTRRWQLERFSAWCAERSLSSPKEVTPAILEQYQRWLFHYRQEKNARPLSSVTQTQYLVAVRGFFRWLKKQGELLHNPALELELPKKPRSLPRRVLTAAEVEQILSAIDVDAHVGLRDRAILETLYSTGLRRAELLRLSLYDVDLEAGTVFVRLGKGMKDRVVPIGERARAWLERYIAESRPLLLAVQDDGTLFLSTRGTPISEVQATKIARGRMEKAQLYRPGSACHVFRHTAATLMLEGGADVRYIQQLLGHGVLTSTQIYTRVSIEKLKEVHARTHPARLGRGPRADAALDDTDTTRKR